jgi:hypothetical protein
MRPWRPDPSLSAWSGLHHLPYDFPSTALITVFLGTLTGTTLTTLALPSLTTVVTVFTLSLLALNASA